MNLYSRTEIADALASIAMSSTGLPPEVREVEAGPERERLIQVDQRALLQVLLAVGLSFGLKPEAMPESIDQGVAGLLWGDNVDTRQCRRKGQ